jgi:hypothetical protein
MEVPTPESADAHVKTSPTTSGIVNNSAARRAAQGGKGERRAPPSDTVVYGGALFSKAFLDLFLSAIGENIPCRVTGKGKTASIAAVIREGEAREEGAAFHVIRDIDMSHEAARQHLRSVFTQASMARGRRHVVVVENADLFSLRVQLALLQLVDKYITSDTKTGNITCVCTDSGERTIHPALAARLLHLHLPPFSRDQLMDWYAAQIADQLRGLSMCDAETVAEICDGVRERCAIRDITVLAHRLRENAFIIPHEFARAQGSMSAADIRDMYVMDHVDALCVAFIRRARPGTAEPDGAYAAALRLCREFSSHADVLDYICGFVRALDGHDGAGSVEELFGGAAEKARFAMRVHGLSQHVHEHTTTEEFLLLLMGAVSLGDVPSPTPPGNSWGT